MSDSYEVSQCLCSTQQLTRSNKLNGVRLQDVRDKVLWYSDDDGCHIGGESELITETGDTYPLAQRSPVRLGPQVQWTQNNCELRWPLQVDTWEGGEDRELIAHGERYAYTYQPSGKRDTGRQEEDGERHNNIEAGTGDSPNLWSDDDDDDALESKCCFSIKLWNTDGDFCFQWT
jgi:hypothetical protein